MKPLEFLIDNPNNPYTESVREKYSKMSPQAQERFQGIVREVESKIIEDLFFKCPVENVGKNAYYDSNNNTSRQDSADPKESERC